MEDKIKKLEAQKQELKNHLTTYLATNGAMDEIEGLLEADPENKSLEKEWDKAYKDHFGALQAAQKIIANILETSETVARKIIAENGEQILKSLEAIA